MTRSRSSVAAAGILLAHFGSLLVELKVPLAHAGWSWSPSPMPMPSPAPSPPSPPAMVCGTWGTWGACSVTCGAGSRERSRAGSCSPYRESEACDLGACVAPCGDWTQWAACPVTCGGGTRSRSRSGGCSSSTESEGCNAEACPVPCGAWGEWSSCTATCGAGTRSRSRGECSGASLDSEACNANACVEATAASSAACGVWQQWSQCTASCGPATRMRSRGGECQPFLESEACSQAACVAPSPPQNPVAPSPTTTQTTVATTMATAATTAAATGRLTNVVEVRMRLAADFSHAAEDIDTFREAFRQGMADAAGISKDRIIVSLISRGSIIVDFLVSAAQGSQGSQGSQGEITAAQAVQDLETRLGDQSYLWPAVLRPMMAEGASVQAKKTTTMNQEELDAMVVLSTGSNTVFLTPEAGFGAPPGCSCVAGDGITAGCAKHKGMSPAWCLVASGCGESMEGASGPWAFCVETIWDNSDGSPDPNKIIIASGNGSAVNIASMWLLFAIFVQGLLRNPFVP